MPQKHECRERGSRTHKTVESEGSKRGVFYMTADDSTVEKGGEKTLLMSTSDGAQLRKVTFQVANVNKALGSVSKIGEDWKQSGA